MKLWYKQPAKSWNEALPIGNGRLGAMVYGNMDKEIIPINEDSLWSGYPRDLNPKSKAHYYTKAVELSKGRKHYEAQRIIENELTSGWSQSYLPVGDLVVNYKNIGTKSAYKRKLDLNNAVATVEYEADGVKYCREMFASSPQNVIVMNLTSSKNKGVSFSMGFRSPLRSDVCVKKPYLIVEGEAPAYVEPSYINNCDNPVEYYEEDEKRGMLFRSMATVVSQGGAVAYTDTEILVENADSVIILIAIRTSFAGFENHPFISAKEYKKRCKRDLDSAVCMTYDQLFCNHIRDYKSFYDRVLIDLGDSDAASLPTDERLYRFENEKDDNGLYALLFQYGRYLLISSSRPDTQATNLQGIWNNELRPAWSSNYTININTQMNYWPVFSCALGEMQQPLNRLIKELSITGQTTAKEVYGARGFTAHHNTDIWRLSSAVGNHQEHSAGYAFWNMSAGWLCRHLFDQYEYTLDKDFLKNEAYPIMKSAAEFILDIMIEDTDGYLIICPSTSPENTFIHNGNKCNVSPTTTMTMSIAKELFNHCIESCKILGIDNQFKNVLESIVCRLYPYKKGSKGQLLEWIEEYEEENRHHRHISHLYGLHPSNDITVEDHPEIAEACKTSLNLRGDDGTGWSLAWKINQWARLLDGNRALKLLNRQLRVVDQKDEHFSTKGGTYINMLDAHPPFQIDGNFGATSGIAEMLLQSRNNKVFILPAVPPTWAKGKVKGLQAKGRITVNIEWGKNDVTTSLLSDISQTITLFIKGTEYGEIELKAGIQKAI